MLSSLKVALVAQRWALIQGLRSRFLLPLTPCLTILRGHSPCFSCCYSSWPGLGSRVSSRAGLALLITTCTLERDPYPDLMVFPKGLHTDGFSLLPMTVHSSKGVLGSGLESEPVHLQEPSMALTRPCWRKRGQLWPQGSE